MAERRMISKKVLSADKFLELPPKARLLYVYMTLYADDQGFTNGVQRLIWECRASNGDLKKLIERGFVIHFESGAYLIAHWQIMNKVPPSRATETSFLRELDSVILNEDKVYVKFEETPEQIQAIRRQIADDLPDLGKQNVDSENE